MLLAGDFKTSMQRVRRSAKFLVEGHLDAPPSDQPTGGEVGDDCSNIDRHQKRSIHRDFRRKEADVEPKGSALWWMVGLPYQGLSGRPGSNICISVK